MAILYRVSGNKCSEILLGNLLSMVYSVLPKDDDDEPDNVL